VVEKMSKQNKFLLVVLAPSSQETENVYICMYIA